MQQSDDIDQPWCFSWAKRDMKAQERLAMKAAMNGPPGVERLLESGSGKRG